MSSRRFLSWSAASANIRRDRAVVPAGLMSTRAMVQTYARTRKLPLVVAGQYDRAAIMRTATLAARDHQERYGSAWTAAMSVALQAAWQAARTARAAAAQ